MLQIPIVVCQSHRWYQWEMSDNCFSEENHIKISQLLYHHEIDLETLWRERYLRGSRNAPTQTCPLPRPRIHGVVQKLSHHALVLHDRRDTRAEFHRTNLQGQQGKQSRERTGTIYGGQKSQEALLWWLIGPLGFMSLNCEKVVRAHYKIGPFDDLLSTRLVICIM